MLPCFLVASFGQFGIPTDLKYHQRVKEGMITKVRWSIQSFQRKIQFSFVTNDHSDKFWHDLGRVCVVAEWLLCDVSLPISQSPVPSSCQMMPALWLLLIYLLTLFTICHLLIYQPRPFIFNHLLIYRFIYQHHFHRLLIYPPTPFICHHLLIYPPTLFPPFTDLSTNTIYHLPWK